MIFTNFRAPEARFGFSSEQIDEFSRAGWGRHSYDVCGPLGTKRTALQSPMSDLDQAKTVPQSSKMDGRGSLQNQPSIRLCTVGSRKFHKSYTPSNFTVFVINHQKSCDAPWFSSSKFNQNRSDRNIFAIEPFTPS